MKAKKSLHLSDLAREILFHGYWGAELGFSGRPTWPKLHDPKSGTYPRKIGVYRPTPDHEEYDHIASDYRLYLSRSGFAALHL